MPTDTRDLTVEPTERITAQVFRGTVIYDGAIVSNDEYASAAERRDDIVSTLAANHDEVDQQEVDEILAEHDDEQADTAVALVAELYDIVGVDVTLTTETRDLGPAVFFSVFTDYGNGDVHIEHHSSEFDRLSVLRDRAAAIDERHPASFFETATAEECRKVLEYMVASTHGRVHLVTARRTELLEHYTS